MRKRSRRRRRRNNPPELLCERETTRTHTRNVIAGNTPWRLRVQTLATRHTSSDLSESSNNRNTPLYYYNYYYYHYYYYYFARLDNIILYIMMKKTPEETTRRGDVSAKRNKVEIRLRFFFVLFVITRLGSAIFFHRFYIYVRVGSVKVYTLTLHCSGRILSATRTDDIIVQFLIRRRKRNCTAETTETVKYIINRIILLSSPNRLQIITKKKLLQFYY